MDLTKIFSDVMSFGISGLTVEKILSALVLLAVCLIVVKLLMKTVDKLLQRTGIDRSLHTFLKSAIKVVLLFLTVLIVADTLGIPMTSLIAVLSVAGLAVSLAVQNSLSNVAGGIQLLTSKPFTVGDYVEAGGIAGTGGDFLHPDPHGGQQADPGPQQPDRRGEDHQLHGGAAAPGGSDVHGVV